MYIVPSDIFVSYKLVPEVRMSYKCATSRLMPLVTGLFIPFLVVLRASVA